MYEERRFRPFDVAKSVEEFFKDARLLVAGNPDVYIDERQSRTVTESDLTSGHFVLELARDGDSFADLKAKLREGVGDLGPNADVGLVAIATSKYLKLAEVVLIEPIEDLERLIDLRRGPVAEPFQATHHGCDIDVALVLLNERPELPLEPWRKGTWLACTKFGLRTSIDGFGYVLLPLTDEERAERNLAPTCLRYIDVRDSLGEAGGGTGGNVDVFVDADLLARLEKESSRPWALAFTDQLALDFLTAIIVHALAAPDFAELDWEAVSGTLVGNVLELVAKTSDEATLQVRLDELRNDPNRFLASVEGMLDMRANSKRLVGS